MREEAGANAHALHPSSATGDTHKRAQFPVLVPYPSALRVGASDDSTSEEEDVIPPSPATPTVNGSKGDDTTGVTAPPAPEVEAEGQPRQHNGQ